jgi:hypothetical protein
MKWLICVVYIFITCATAIASTDIHVGTIKTTVAGAASIERAQKVLPAKIGDNIIEGDKLRTGTGGSLGAVLKDDSFISIGPNSEIIISEFRFAPAEGKLSVITRMIKGTAAYLSGIIAKISPQSVRFETPVASVGVRGTKFLVQVDDD